MDKEFGMVKEEVRIVFTRLLHCNEDILCHEKFVQVLFNTQFSFQISDDDKVLPGVEGKIVVWVEEE